MHDEDSLITIDLILLTSLTCNKITRTYAPARTHARTHVHTHTHTTTTTANKPTYNDRITTKKRISYTL